MKTLQELKRNSLQKENPKLAAVPGSNLLSGFNIPFTPEQNAVLSAGPVISSTQADEAEPKQAQPSAEEGMRALCRVAVAAGGRPSLRAACHLVARSPHIALPQLAESKLQGR